MKKFGLGLLSIAIAGVVAFPGSVGAEESYNKEVVFEGNLSTSPDFHEMRDEIIYADYFHHLELLGERLDGIFDKHSMAFHEVNYLDISLAQTIIKDDLNQLTYDRNEIAYSLRYVKDPAAAQILSNYLSAINKYKVANEYLVKFQKQKTQYNYKMFESNNSAAVKLSVKYKKQASERYYFYISRPIDSLNDFLGIL